MQIGRSIALEPIVWPATHALVDAWPPAPVDISHEEMSMEPHASFVLVVSLLCLDEIPCDGLGSCSVLWSCDASACCSCAGVCVHCGAYVHVLPFESALTVQDGGPQAMVARAGVFLAPERDRASRCTSFVPCTSIA